MMKLKVKHIFFILQFSIILLPFAPIADIIYYVIDEGSLSDGLGAMLYDSMLNCSDTEWSKIAAGVILLISAISCIVYFLIRRHEKKVGDNL